MYVGRDFDPIDDEEIVTVGFDFTNEMLSGETLSSPAWRCEVVTGTDPAPGGRLAGGPSLAGTITTQRFSEPVAGVKYRLVAEVDTNLGNHYLLWSHIEGTAPA